MEVLAKLDDVVSELAQTLYACSPMPTWQRQRLTAKYTPDASVGRVAHVYEDADGAIDEGIDPAFEYRRKIDELTLRHWQLTQDLGQPRWYKMIVTVERSGKFAVEFEYKDDYQEGDIMRD